MPLRLFAAVLVLAGCGPTSEPEVTPPTPSAPPPAASVPTPPDTTRARADGALAIDGDGLRVVSPSGSTTALGFGAPVAGVVSAVTALRGEPSESGTQDECGAGPLEYTTWPDGLTVYAEGGEFAGWSLNGLAADPPVTTMTGLGLGSSRSDLDDAYEADVQQTTLGTEFQAGGLSGILDDAGRVSALWAGVSCVFR